MIFRYVEQEMHLVLFIYKINEVYVWVLGVISIPII